jgi:hypothetical protein
MWKLGLAKLTVGALVAVLPGLIALGALGLIEAFGSALWPELRSGFAWYRDSSIPGLAQASPYLLSSLALIGVALSLYLWTAALSVNSSNEVRAAAWGLGGIVVWWLVLGGLANLTENDALRTIWWRGHAFQTLSAIGPLGFAQLGPVLNKNYSLLFFLVSCCSHAFIVVWFVYRFAQRSAPRPTAPGTPGVTTNLELAFLSAPRRSPLTALLWKQWRECLPIVAVGLAGVLAATTLVVLVGVIYSGPNPLTFRIVCEFVSAMMIFFGVLVAVIVGIGVMLNDLGPSLNTFWRSRPMRPDQVFWTQYAVGGGVLLAAFALPSGLLIAFMVERYTEDAFELMAAFMFSAYALAVGCTAVTRHAIYSAILALGGSIGAVVVVEEKIDSVFWGNAILLAIAVGATLIAWVAFRKDWALRS